MTAAARELARKAAASIGAGDLPKVWLRSPATNNSSATSFEFEQALKGFEDEWKKNGGAGFAIVAQNPSAVTGVRISLSESFQDFLWIADIDTGQAHSVVFVSVPKSAVPAAPVVSDTIILNKQFLLSLPDPILDAQILPASGTAAQRLVVLQPERVALFSQVNGTWQIQAQSAIVHDRPWPRDIRGRLHVGAPGGVADLPGTICEVALADSLTVTCKHGSKPWTLFGQGPLQGRGNIVPNRNFFISPPSADNSQGEAQALANIPAGFYSFATLGAQSGPVYAFSTLLDGRAVLFDPEAKKIKWFTNWGSDIAGMATNCGAGSQLLVTGAGDWTVPDTIQAFEFPDRQPVVVSGTVNFSGPVTALWSAGDPSTAIAVSRNLKTGMYEAYSLTLSCGR
ncbi:MAG: hypothetical protein ACYDDI_10175 [Candidatus Acidiferrales bacterium]